MSYQRMVQDAPKLAAEVQAWFAKAEQTDTAEDAEHGAARRGDEMPDGMANKQRRLARLQEALATLQAEAAAYLGPGRIRHDSTDPTARRVLKRSPLTQAMADKIRRAGRRSRYRLRKQLPEPVFGQTKHARGFRQFLLRGLNKVRTEWAMVCTDHNILKLHKAAS